MQLNNLIYTWDDFEEDVPKLISQMKEVGFNPTGIFGIQRGGLVLSVRLSHELDLPLISGGVTKNVLIVDDIADTGKTLEPYRYRGCPILTIYMHNLCPFTPTFYARSADRWVQFPWEKNAKSFNV